MVGAGNPSRLAACAPAVAGLGATGATGADGAGWLLGTHMMLVGEFVTVLISQVSSIHTPLGLTPGGGGAGGPIGYGM